MVAHRIEETLHRIAAAAARYGREADEVKLLAVTKNHPVDVVREAIAAGIRTFGENRVQEAREKYHDIHTEVELHLIGHLQSNKARLVPGFFGWIESIDSLRIAKLVSARAAALGVSCDVLLQYNSSSELSKSGFADPEALLDAAAITRELPALRLRGVMTIGPFTDDAVAVANAFRATRRLFERMQSLDDDAPGMPAPVDTLSMGMTDDLEIAIAEGSTELRIGTAIFGGRGL